MKPSSWDSNMPAVLPTRRKSFHNGSSGRQNFSCRNSKPNHKGHRVSKKVHSNINFSKLDEVCLDVGKVDLSFSASLSNEIGLSPMKAPREAACDFHKVSLTDVNGHADVPSNHFNNTIELEKLKIIRSCYVQLESLEQQEKRSCGMRSRVSNVVIDGAEEKEWKGWMSKISFSKEYGCPFVQIKEGPKVSEVLVMSEDLVDSECKILEKDGVCGNNCKKFETSAFGTCIQDAHKKLLENNLELKENLHELFEDTGELHNFFDCIDFSISKPQFQISQNESFNRKLNFDNDSDVPSGSSKVLGDNTKKRVGAYAHSRVVSSGVKERCFLGFSDPTIFSSKKYAKHFLDYCNKVKIQTSKIEEKLCL